MSVTEAMCWKVSFGSGHVAHVAMPLDSAPNEIEKMARLGLESFLTQRMGGAKTPSVATLPLLGMECTYRTYIHGALG